MLSLFNKAVCIDRPPTLCLEQCVCHGAFSVRPLLLVVVISQFLPALVFGESDEQEKTARFSEQGNSEGQFWLGYMYEEDDGIPQEYSASVEQWRVSAEKGQVKAQCNLGLAYRLGITISKNNAEALKWWRLAAKQGDAKAQHNLGNMYAQGDGVSKNDSEALKWYNMAARQAVKRSQHKLGLIYSNGIGVNRDYRLALMWWSIAASQGLEVSRKAKLNVESRMTRTNIDEAQRMASRCIKSNYKSCG